MDNHVRAARKIAQECACSRIRQASRVLTKIYDTQIRVTGLQESQLSVLVAVAHFGDNGATMGDLARALVMDRTTLTRNLKPIEKAGLVRVARSPHDARARVVLLSRAGERTIEAALPLWEKAQKEFRAALGAQFVERLRADLGGVIALGHKRED